MGILLAFTPFLVFALINRLIGPVAGLSAGAIAAATLIVRDYVTNGRSPKILEIATAFLFGGLTLLSLFGLAKWSVIGVRLTVDAGLLLIVLASLAARRPFTLQYAREQVPLELWTSPEFIQTNYIITASWAVAFAIIVGTEATMLYLKALPPRIGIIAIVVALVGAVKFTSWYPEHVKGAPSPGSV